MIDIKNRSLDDAIRVLKSENYRYEVSDTLYTNKFQLGTIVDQYPQPNTRVKSGRTVRLNIAQPEKSVPIPNLIGQSRRSAELELNQILYILNIIPNIQMELLPGNTQRLEIVERREWEYRLQ